jgi:hypothetical protein
LRIICQFEIIVPQISCGIPQSNKNMTNETLMRGYLIYAILPIYLDVHFHRMRKAPQRVFEAVAEVKPPKWSKMGVDPGEHDMEWG